jgi:hypothetical protein
MKPKMRREIPKITSAHSLDGHKPLNGPWWGSQLGPALPCDEAGATKHSASMETPDVGMSCREAPSQGAILFSFTHPSSWPPVLKNPYYFKEMLTLSLFYNYFSGGFLPRSFGGHEDRRQP